MLQKILDYLKDLKQGRTLKELAAELGIEASALEGMLDFLAKKGKLKVQRTPITGQECSKSSRSCIACPGKGNKNTPAAKYYYLPD